jgi:post-segregation antitoxin (ccd killing protein)
MASTRTTFTLDDALADRARELDVNISRAARDGVAAAVRAELAARDRSAYERHPEQIDQFWTDADVWGDE